MGFPREHPGLLIPGPAGALEAIVDGPVVAPAAAAVICHPHPLHGGTMHNKVVHTLARTFTALGVACVRFNFRGVGQSEGRFADGVGEADDCVAVANWLLGAHPGLPLWLAGFSFGGGVALRAAAFLHPERLVLVAPSVTLHGFGESGTDLPTLVVQGEVDEVVPPEAVRAWQEVKAPQADYIGLPGVGHFFHGALGTLKDTLTDALAGQR